MKRNVSVVAESGMQRVSKVDAKVSLLVLMAEEMAAMLRERMLLRMDLIGQEECVLGADCHYNVLGVNVGDLISYGDQCANQSVSLRDEKRVYEVDRQMVVQRTISTTSDAIPVCHSRGSKSDLFSTPTLQLGQVLAPRTQPVLVSKRVGKGQHHNEESVVTGKK